MESILDRCERIQQHCAPRAPPPARGAAGARPGTAPAAARARWGSRAGAGGGGGTRVTMRSGLLFASPQHVTWDTGAVGEQQGPEMLGACDSWRRTPGPAALASGGEPAAAAPAISPGPAAASPPAPAAATSAPWPAPWAGAVDLNPGFGFAPGSPQRVAAVAPALPGVLARMEQLQGEVRRLDLGRMTHREVLQVGATEPARGRLHPLGLAPRAGMREAAKGRGEDLQADPLRLWLLQHSKRAADHSCVQAQHETW